MKRKFFKKFITTVNVLMLIIGVMFLTACKENFDKFSLSFASQKIEMSLGDEKEYELKIDNYFKVDTSFSFDFDKPIATVLENTINVADDGSVKFTVKSLVAGTTTLKITLLQGNKFIQIPVVVAEKIASFSLNSKNDLFVVRGQTLKLTNTMFDFLPTTTLQKDLDFYYNETKLENGEFGATEETPSSIVITATSRYNSDLNVNMQIKVLDELDLSDVKVSLGEEDLISYDEDDTQFIELIANNDLQYKKTLSLSYNAELKYKYEVVSQKGGLYIETKVSSQWENVIFIDIQQEKSTQISDDFVVVKVSYGDFGAYSKEIRFKVKIVSAPQYVKVNGQVVSSSVDLYDNKLDSSIKEMMLSIYPTKASFKDIKLSFYLYSYNEETEQETKKATTYEVVKNYIALEYDGVEISSNFVVTDLSKTIKYYGKSVIPKEIADKIIIRFTCESDYVDKDVVFNEVSVVIHKSASQFYVDSAKYSSSTIYVEKGTETVFSGFKVVEEDAYIGTIIAIPDYLSNGYIEISQTKDNEASVKIKALNVGSATYSLFLASGISTKIRVIVKEKLDIDNFYLYVASSTNDALAQIEYKQNKNVQTIKSVAVRGTNQSFDIGAYTGSSDDSSMFDLTLVSALKEQISVEKSNNWKITTKVTTNKALSITSTLKTKKIEDFKIVDDKTYDREYSFDVYCFEPIKNPVLSAKNSGDITNTYSQYVSVYDKNTVGYVDISLSEIELKLDIDGKKQEDFANVVWKFSTSAEYSATEKRYTLTESGSVRYGYFYPETMTFVCDGQGEPTGILRIYAVIEEYGKTFETSILITIETYVQVESVWLYNYCPTIYLDAVNSSLTLYPYIMPSNATNKNYAVWFEPSNSTTSSSILQFEYDSTYVLVKYSGYGGGQGILHIVPTSKYKDSNGTYDYSLDIPVYIGEGTKSNPLHISSWQQLKNINTTRGLSRYYVIDTIIDAQNEEIEPFGTLTGGIYGISNVVLDGDNIISYANASIINLNIKKGVKGNYGLFSSIAQNAFVMNLNLTGKINVNIGDEVTKIGLLCAENNGVIKNIYAQIYSSTITTKSKQESFIGGLCGLNNGTIVNDMTTRPSAASVISKDPTLANDLKYKELNVDGKTYNSGEVDNNLMINEGFETYPFESTLFVEMKDQFTLNLDCENTATQSMLNFGGVVGKNTGLIRLRDSNARYNLFGTSAYVNILTNVIDPVNFTSSSIGGICGRNTGTISDMLVKGTIKAKDMPNVGGLIGFSEGGLVYSNTSRVFVYGQNNVAGLIGFGQGTLVKDNKVESVDNGNKLGLNASLVVCNTGSTSAPIYNGVCMETNNFVLSYFARTKVNYDTAQKDNLDIGSYFGDYLRIGADGQGTGEIFNRVSTTSKLGDLIDKNGKYTLNGQTSIIFMYYQAEDNTKNQYLNKLNKQKLPSDLFGENVNFVEYSITSKSTSIISVASNGELTINGIGKVELKLTSALNYNDSITLVCYATRYVGSATGNSLELYATPDRNDVFITSANTINVSNRNTYTIYPRYVANVSVGNMNIGLIENDELHIETVTDNESIKVIQSYKTIILQGNGNEDQIINNIKFYIYFSKDNTTRYLSNDEKSEFVSAKPSSETYKIKTEYNQGIYSIDIDKTNMTIVPSDIVSLRVYYLTDDEQDTLVLTMFYNETATTITYDKTKPEAFEKYFMVKESEIFTLSDGRRYVDYTLSMNTENSVKIGQYLFTFSGSDGMAKKSITVNFISQPITNVMVKNYTFADNEDIAYVDEEGIYYYNTSYSMQETDTATAGEVNILRVVISPYFADYDYVTIVNSSVNVQNKAIAQFGLLVPSVNKNQSVISSNSYYIENGIIVKKSAIMSGDLTVLYRLSTAISEDEQLSFDISFYDKNGNKVYDSITKSVSTVVNKKLNITIANKNPISVDSVNNSTGYMLARGNTYVLNVESLGYNEDEIVINSSSKFATITKVNGRYLLNLSKDITYTTGSIGYEFRVSYYGFKKVEGQIVKSKTKNLSCMVVEYVIEGVKPNGSTQLANLSGVLSTNEITLQIGNVGELREKVLNSLSVDYSNDAVSGVNALKQSIKNKGDWYVNLNGNYIDLKDIKADEKNSNLLNSDLDSRFNEYKSLFQIEVNYSTNVYSVLARKYMDNPTYSFGISAEVYYYEGFIVVKDNESPSEGAEDDILPIGVSLLQNTSMDSPWPVENYNDLISMKEGGYYILVSDIVIPTNFNPITTDIAYLDGNGYKIIFDGVYKGYSNVSNFGLFSTVSATTTLQNIEISINGQSGTTLFEFDNSLSSNALLFGLLCSVNYGIITNCSISVGRTSASVKVVNNALIDITNLSYVGGLVAQNDGYITHSRVELKLESIGSNLGGFVAINNKHISNCYVKNSLIKNSSTNVNNSTGGFVVVNNSNIYGCYIEGKNSEGIARVYCNDSNYIVKASSIAGAFVYLNSGNVSDCYANIPVVSSSRNSGFVGTNKGKIYNTYTSSKLGENDTENYPFFIANDKEDGIENSYFISDPSINFNSDINQTNNKTKGLKPLTFAEYSAVSERINKFETTNEITNESTDADFLTFAVNSNNQESKGVWFNLKSVMNYKDASYADYVSLAEYSVNGTAKSFVSKSMQLVSANLIAYSRRIIISTSYDETTGETKYEYAYSSPNGEYGSVHNPIVISSAKMLEDTIISTSKNNINNYSYRIVKDINYEDEKIVNSKLYKTIFAGNIEGNFLEIAGFSINSNENLLNSGFFAQIGNGSNYALVQNITFSPKYINLPNSYNVGAIAGTINRSYLYNVKGNGYYDSNNPVIVIGKNIVGGLFARTILAFDMFNISSSISANAYKTSSSLDFNTDSAREEILYNEYGVSNNSTVSYSGAIIGYLGGEGILSYASIDGQVASIGMVSGLMFGGIGLNASVNNANANIDFGNNSFVRASAFGGLIVGDLLGTLQNVEINKLESVNTEKEFSIFKNQPISPIAVGGVVGILRNGTIAKANVSLSLNSNEIEKIYIVGGIVGLMECGKVLDCSYSGAEIKGSISLGGIVGQLKDTLNDGDEATIDECHVEGTSIALNRTASDQRLSNYSDTELISCVGGIVGSYYCEQSQIQTNVKFNSSQLNNNKLTNVTIQGFLTVFGLSSTYSTRICAGSLIGGTMFTEINLLLGDNGANHKIFITSNNVMTGTTIEITTKNLQDPTMGNYCHTGTDVLLSNFYIGYSDNTESNKKTESAKIKINGKGIKDNDWLKGSYKLFQGTR